MPHAHDARGRRDAWPPQVEKQRIPIEVRKGKYEKDLEEMREGMLESMGQEVDAAIQRLPPVFLQAELEAVTDRYLPSTVTYRHLPLPTVTYRHGASAQSLLAELREAFGRFDAADLRRVFLHYAGATPPQPTRHTAHVSAAASPRPGD